MKKVFFISGCIAAIALFGFSMKKSSANLLIESNVEALVQSEGPVLKQKNLYMYVEDGKMYGYCGEITTGNPYFTWCSDWMKTDSDTLHDKCFVYE